MEFTAAFVRILNQLPLPEAVGRVKAASQLANTNPDEAERDYLILRGEVVEPKLAARALEGIPLVEHSELIAPVLASGGKVELTLDHGKILIHATPPVISRQRFIFTHKGKQIDGPLLRFIRAHYPRSRAAQILSNPGRSSKTVVGAWEAVQRDPTLKKHFSRKLKTKRQRHQRAA